MIASLAFVFLFGLSFAEIFQRLKLPRIVGMLLCGILLGPFVLNLLDDSILNVSAELRKMALVIILIKAGLSLDISDLKQVGRPAILMSLVPASMELLGCVLLAPFFLPVNRLEAAILGSVLAAVSPAVVVPRMVKLIETKYGTKKSIPQLILASASLDDVFVIVLFTSFINIALGSGAQVADFINIPLSIVLGIALGILVGYCLAWFFETAYAKKRYVRNSMKVIIVLGTAFLLVSVEEWVKGVIPVSGILAVMSMAATLKIHSVDFVSKRLSEKFGKLWLAAEVILFVLVGAAVDIRYTIEAGLGAVLCIFAVLVFRSLGVGLSLLGTQLNMKERIFCVLSYLPKATVQAAIGSVPLSLGLPCGKVVLSVAVLAILITAPLGALAIDNSYETFLEKEYRQA